ncbi:MAG TPA: hypothetical protein PLR20_15620 [Syntrophales bacterium]|nr:hypothetical protein [Syntrophales bacterium]
MSNGFAKRVTKIKGLSDRRRLPRLGSIRLGLKAKSKSSGREYPMETDYFVLTNAPGVEKIYGPQPKELDVMLPLNDLESVFPCSYKYYGSSRGLKCEGDGETATRVNEETKEMERVSCPCSLLEEGKCKQSGTLMVMLPKVSVGGVYQIRTTSYNSIVDINSGLEYVAALAGRFALIPLKLRRVPIETHHDEKKQTHYTLQIIFDGDVHTLNNLRLDTQRVLEHPRYQLPAPVETNPEADAVDIIVDDEEKAQAPAQAAPPDPPAPPAASEEDVQDPEYPEFEEKTEPATPPPASQGDKGGKINSVKAKAIRGTLAHHGIPEKNFLTAFGIKKIEDLANGIHMDAVKWIIEKGESGKEAKSAQ